MKVRCWKCFENVPHFSSQQRKSEKSNFERFPTLTYDFRCVIYICNISVQSLCFYKTMQDIFVFFRTCKKLTREKYCQSPPEAFTRFNFIFFSFRCRDLLIKAEGLEGVLRGCWILGGQMVKAKQSLWFNLSEKMRQGETGRKSREGDNLVWEGEVV